MSQSNFREHHIEAWKKYRNALFHEDETSALRFLVPDKDYIRIAIETAARLAKKDVEDPEFSDLLRVANEELSREFFKTSKTNFQSIYHTCAYATDFGSRSVAAIQAALMEYFINYEHARFEPRLKILDLGSGTGASTYGFLSLLDYFSKDNKIFAEQLKHISVDLVDEDDQA